jgi:hypothetical protein
MKALSTRQPNASLIVAGIKPVENRSRPTKYRGPLLIHAAGKDTIEDYAKAMTIAQRCASFEVQCSILDLDEFPRGPIIGQVDLVDCVQNHPSPWAEPGAWHWVLANAVAFPKPVPYPGRLGLFDAPEPDAEHLFKPHDGRTRRVCLTQEPCDVVITRPGRWGNPYRVLPSPAGYPIDVFPWFLWRGAPVYPNNVGPGYRTKSLALIASLALYAEYLHANTILRQHLPSLKGKRLGCFCPVGDPCHGDVLVRLVEEVVGTPKPAPAQE